MKPPAATDPSTVVSTKWRGSPKVRARRTLQTVQAKRSDNAIRFQDPMTRV